MNVGRFALVIALGLACDAPISPSPAPHRWLEQPLLTQWAPGPAGEGAEPRWLQVSGRWRRALVCEARCRADFPVRVTDSDQEPLGTGSLRGTAALVPRRGAQPGAATTFRIRVDGVVAFEQQATGSWSREFEVPVSGVPSAATRIALEVQTAGSASPETAPAAVWLDPRIEWRVAQRAETEGNSLNVLLVTADTTRWDDLSIHGGAVRSRGLEALAAEGIVFTNVHTVACCTTPSHASLLTSSSARTHGVYHSGGAILGPELPTLAEELGRRGWATAAFVSAAVLDRRLGLARGFDLYDDPLADQRRADLSVSLLLDWLDRHERRRADSPFFAWLHLYDPHQPYAAPAPFTDAYPADIDEPERERLTALMQQTAARAQPPGFLWARDLTATSPADLQATGDIARGLYRGELAFIDEQLSQVTQALRDRKLDDRTLVIFTSDHGENFLDRGGDLAFDHHGLHADVTHVPLVIRHPRGNAAGSRLERMASSLDIAPTILAALGVPAPDAWSGGDLLSSPRTPGGFEHVIIESARHKEIAVRTTRWLYREVREAWRDRPGELRRLGYEPGRPQQLYDLAADPDAKTNLYDSDHPALPEIRAHLTAFLETPEGPAAAPLVSEEHLRALEALGYVESSEPNGD